MNQSTVHLITLLCAVIAKLSKGIEACLPDDCTLLSCRVLAQLSLPESSRMRANELARALVLRPAEVNTALLSLMGAQYVWHSPCEPDKANEDLDPPSYTLTDRGLAHVQETNARIDRFLADAWSSFSQDDRSFLRDFFYGLLVKPGSFFAHRAHSLIEGQDIPVAYCVTAISMLFQTVDAAAKCDAGLSFTDFRFLLELYPKRRDVEKRLRAKELVSYLRVGRSYVSTAAARLEERGLILRIPDDQDARGVLFALTATGERTVLDVTDDLHGLIVGMLGQRSADPIQLLRILRFLMKGSDRALSDIRRNAQ